MQKRLAFWKIAAITLGMWLAIIWFVQAHQESVPAARAGQVLQQACDANRADLRIQAIEVTTRGIGQPFDISVRIRNDSTGNQGLADSWAFLYVDRTPTGAPNVQAFAQTSQLTDTSSSISANFTITSGYATVGWHTVSAMIDATDTIPNEGCDGENNNQGATSFEIQGVQPPTPTNRPPPTPTPFPPPQIYLFEPQQATIGRGDAVVLRWQVAGESVSVTLDDEPVPIQGSLPKYPNESHVYTLRAENPGGVVQKTSQITVADPTVTPTPTEVPCEYATIHEFGASPSSVIRGQKVTVYWDVAGASQVFLNGEPVPDVSAREFKLDRTTTFVLVARNACGDVEEELTVQANYATATPTQTPTLTLTPTRTATPTPTIWATDTPTRTPTRYVLPTHTYTPNPSGTQPVAPTMTSTSSAFDSPLGTPTATIEPPAGTLTATVSITPTAAVGSPTATAIATETWTPTSTATPTAAVGSPTWTVTATWTPAGITTPTSTSTVIQATRTVEQSGPTAGAIATHTPDVGPSGPILAPTTTPPSSTIRLYLCPLAVLLLFAIGVVIMSIVVPRIQERQQDMDDLQYPAALYGVASASASPGNPYPGNPATRGDAPFTEGGPAEGPSSRTPDDSLLGDNISLDDVSFASNGPLLDDERPPQIVSFDPLIDDLGPVGRQESERVPSTSKGNN